MARQAKHAYALYEKPDSPFWWCIIRGKRQSTGKTDFNEALAEAARRELAPADEPVRPKGEASIANCVTTFLAHKRATGRAGGTFHMYGVKSRQLGRVLGEATDVNAIPPGMDAYVNQRRDEGAAASTIKRELSVMSGILKVAKRNGVFRGDVKTILPEPIDDPAKPIKRHLTQAQLPRMLRELPRNHAAAAAFLVAAACRLSDMVRATAEDLTVKPGFIRVWASKTKKNRGGPRFQPITILNEALLKEIAAATAGRKGKLFDPWTNIVRDLDKACARASACEECRHGIYQRRSATCSACAQVEIVPRVTPTDLRRTYAMWLRAASVKVEDIAEVLGHSDPRMAQLVYAQQSPEMLRNTLNHQLQIAPLSPMAVFRRSDGKGARRAKWTG